MHFSSPFRTCRMSVSQRLDFASLYTSLQMISSAIIPFLNPYSPTREQINFLCTRSFWLPIPKTSAMLATTFQFFKSKRINLVVRKDWSLSLCPALLCLALFCTWVQVGLTQPSGFLDNEEDPTNLEKSWINNYPALLNTHFNGQLPLEDYFYHQKPSNAEHSALAKRLIMLPRVGRRSVRATSSWANIVLY